MVAAAIEQNHDENGIIWPDAIAPYEIIIIPIGLRKSVQVAQTTESIYNNLVQAGFDVLLDDRDERPGVMFAEADLLGIPHRLVVGDRGLKRGVIEYKQRAAEAAEELPLDDVIETLGTLIETIQT